MNSYQDLIVWQKSMDLVIETYRIIKLLPKSEMYVLSDQMRRAAISIPSNIAEGFGRHASRDYSRFLSIARGSKYELETQLRICVKIGYIEHKEIVTALKLCDEIGKMLNSLIATLSQKADS